MAQFPTSLSNIPTRGSLLSGGTGSAHSVVHDAIEAEIEAIAAELGTTPSAGYATVAARLAAIEGGDRSSNPLTLAPSVNNYGGTYASAYSSNAGGLTVIEGMIRNNTGGALPAGTAIAQIAVAGHIPTVTHPFWCGSTSGGMLRVDIEYSTGQIRLIGNSWANSDILGLSGIVFVAL